MNFTDKMLKTLIRLIEGETVPASSAKNTLIDELIAEKILWVRGKQRKTIQCPDRTQLTDYLYNHYQIRDLNDFATAKNRAEFTVAAADSKYSSERVFKGFLVNCYEPVHTQLNGEDLLLNPREGSFTFIYDFESFQVDEAVTIVGVENAMNFRFIQKQTALFPDLKPLFISRYPQNQSRDFISWMKQIPNPYYHFGDFDLAGIGIYLNEYKKYLGERAQFLIPENIENTIRTYGNRERYDKQRMTFKIKDITEQKLVNLVEMICREKKGLDQEFFIQ